MLLAAFFFLFFIGKKGNDLLHRDYDLMEELVHKDNPALALALTGYYFGLVFSIGGVVVGPSHGIVNDVMDMAVYGVLSIVLLNLSWLMCDRIILYKFKISEELIRDRNQGTGAVSFGVCMASGLVIFGAVSGEGGSIWTAIAFWAIGQLILMVAVFLYNFMLPFDIHDEIEKDNIAAGISLSGVLIAMGIIIGLAAEGNFYAWRTDLPEFIVYALIGLALLPVVRFLTDKILLPTVNLTDEIAGQKVPNVGAAYIEAFSYIAAALIVFWCI
jgi:uncharacterized membrane protein YjfL (UPF0719 family)